MHREGQKIASLFLEKQMLLMVVALVKIAATVMFSKLETNEFLLCCIYGLLVSGMIFLSWFIRSKVLFTAVSTSIASGPFVVIGSSSMVADQGFAMLLILSCAFLVLAALVSFFGNSNSLRSS